VPPVHQHVGGDDDRHAVHLHHRSVVTGRDHDVVPLRQPSGDRVDE
jgi:hypothetical protein